MVLVSYSGREINAKLVYYGPGLSGKTTNLEYIYGSIPQGQRGKMVSMKTKTERTLFFDFLPVNLGELSGFKTRFLLYTVPGQVYYNATRKLVLKGVDAVVFVADSKRGKMDENLESLDNLRQNLLEQGVDLDTIPWVIQYNKRDLPDVYTIDELEEVLNPDKVPIFEAVAMTGQGVVDTFKGVSRLLLRRLSKDIGAPAPGRPAAPAPVASHPEAAPSGGRRDTPHTPEHVPDQPVVRHQETAAQGGFPSVHDAPGAPPSDTDPPGASERDPGSENQWTPDPVTQDPTPVVEAVQHSCSEGRIPFAGDAAADTDEQDQDQEGRGFSVGDRLRRWLSRPNGQQETQSQFPQDADEQFGERVDAGQYREQYPPDVPAGHAAQADQVEPVAEPPAKRSEPSPAERRPAPPRTARQPRPARPREVLVPLELSHKDLETGITLKLVLQMPQEEYADEGDGEEAA